MAKPASIADLKAQKVTEVDLFSGDIEAARESQVVLLNLIDDQSARAKVGVDSFVLFDLESNGIEDTKTDGTEQSDLAGGALPTTLAINQDKTVPGYFYYKLGEHSRLDWVKAFVNGAPTTAILAVEQAAIAALRGIGANAGKYKQLSGTNSAGTANTVPTVADYNFAIKELCETMKLRKAELRSIGSVSGAAELPNIFGAYDKEASGAMAEFAKMNGYVQKVLGIPHFSSEEMATNEHIIFHWRAVAYAIRTMAQLTFEGQASKSRDYYGVRISYGVVARQDNRAVVMQSGVAYVA